MTQPDAEVVLRRVAGTVAPAIDRAVERLAPGLRPPVAHHLAGGGKRVRAALVLLAARAAGGDEADALDGAVGIELVHNYSLVHDDLIDGDRERRHRPTVWAAFGPGLAIVGGDALAALAIQILLDEPTPARARCASVLADATQAMIGGQADDMAFESRRSVTVAECLAMEAAKTGALLECAATLGALLAGAPDEVTGALGDFGSHLGVAFQAVDDLLGIWGDPAVTGKPVGSDLLAGKKTLPVAMALEGLGSRAGALHDLLAGEPDAGSGSDPRLTEAELERAVSLVEEGGGRRGATETADTHLHQALAALGRVRLDPLAAAELTAVARFVTERDR